MTFGWFLIAPLLVAGPSLYAQQTIAPAINQAVYLQQADTALRDGRLTQAGEMITWLDRNGTEISRDDVMLLKAEYAIAKRDVSAAAAALSVVESPERNLCRLHAAKGWVSANLKVYDDAILALAKASRACPEDAGVWNLLGLVLLRKGESDAAVEAFGQARILAPDDAGILNNHALALLQKGEVRLAMQQLDIAAVTAPANAMVAANRDFVSGMLGLTPARQAQESDAVFGARLISHAQGAKAASNGGQANALFARALLTMDRFDQNIWSEIQSKEGTQ